MKNLMMLFMMMLTTAIMANDTNPVRKMKMIDTDASVVSWVGKKVTGEHSGVISVKSGSLEFENGKLVDGMIEIDMNSIKCTDLEGKPAKNLEGHLKSDDFFGVPNHPTARFRVTGTEDSKKDGYVTITGELTIKGITKDVSFDAMLTDTGAKGTMSIDRTKFDVKYGSGSFFDGLGDKMIYDNFDLELDIKYVVEEEKK